MAQRKPNRTTPPAKEKPLAPVSVVIDTNVFIDVHSIHDLTNDVNRLAAELGDVDAALDHPIVKFRLARARESMLLAMYLHKIKATSWSLHTESVTMLTRFSPPTTPGGRSVESDFTRAFVWFVKDYLLRRWNPVFPASEDHVVKDAADLALLDYAEKNGLPIVTNEGVTPDGLNDTKKNSMRKRAPDRGVHVFAPREFYEGKIDPDEEIEAFFQRFRERAPVYLERRGFRDEMGKVLGVVHGIYKMTLQGVVEGRDRPLVV